MIAVIGSGVMGKGIAIEFAKHNREVLLVSAGRHLSGYELSNEVKKVIERYNIENEDDILSRIITTNEYSYLNQCELVIEAVAEDLNIKRQVVESLKEYVNSNAIIASNTSSLSVYDIFNDIIPLERVVGLHFFNPVQVMKLVEISYHSQISEKTLIFAKDIIRSINKEYVIVKNSPGFIVNRLLIPMINEAARMVDEGIASPEDIDKAMKFGANHPIGPLKLSDLIGNDVTLSILKLLKKELGHLNISESLIKLVEENKLGRKTKSGFFNY